MEKTEPGQRVIHCEGLVLLTSQCGLGGLGCRISLSLGDFNPNVFEGITDFLISAVCAGYLSLVDNAGWLAHRLASASPRGPTPLHVPEAAGVGRPLLQSHSSQTHSIAASWEVNESIYTH